MPNDLALGLIPVSDVKAAIRRSQLDEQDNSRVTMAAKKKSVSFMAMIFVIDCMCDRIKCNCLLYSVCRSVVLGT